MHYILNIHTATETAIVNLSKGSEALYTKTSSDPKQHAAFLHMAINELLRQEHITMKKVDAIGVTAGPGSYTGMRVALAAAKGFCYALDIPLITFNTLEVMAASTADFIEDIDALYCPMLDARRMEVYTAVYTYNLKEIKPPVAKVITEEFYLDFLEGAKKIVFSGSGSKKVKNFIKRPGFVFSDAGISTGRLSQFSWKKFQESDFENLSYAQPLYIKEFYTTSESAHL
jgi:tRNA threonylcarbamoyladenosine biosynthesis protein TsaB